MVHIREKLLRRGGNQYYRDRNVREAATLCRDPVTDRDLALRDATTAIGKKWIAENPGMVCKKCLQHVPERQKR